MRSQCSGCSEPADVIDMDYNEPWCWDCKRHLDKSKNPDDHINNFKTLDAISEEEMNQIVEGR